MDTAAAAKAAVAVIARSTHATVTATAIVAVAVGARTFGAASSVAACTTTYLRWANAAGGDRCCHHSPHGGAAMRVLVDTVAAKQSRSSQSALPRVGCERQPWDRGRTIFRRPRQRQGMPHKATLRDGGQGGPAVGGCAAL